MTSKNVLLALALHIYNDILCTTNILTETIHIFNLIVSILNILHNRLTTRHINKMRRMTRHFLETSILHNCSSRIINLSHIGTVILVFFSEEALVV